LLEPGAAGGAAALPLADVFALVFYFASAWLVL
jgi:hypothetical protein